MNKESRSFPAAFRQDGRVFKAGNSLAIRIPRAIAKNCEVVLPAGGRVTGVALADQIKSLDWRTRGAGFADDVPAMTLRDVRSLVATFLDLR